MKDEAPARCGGVNCLGDGTESDAALRRSGSVRVEEAQREDADGTIPWNQIRRPGRAMSRCQAMRSSCFSLTERASRSSFAAQPGGRRFGQSFVMCTDWSNPNSGAAWISLGTD